MWRSVFSCCTADPLTPAGRLDEADGDDVEFESLLGANIDRDIERFDLGVDSDEDNDVAALSPANVSPKKKTAHVGPSTNGKKKGHSHSGHGHSHHHHDDDFGFGDEPAGNNDDDDDEFFGPVKSKQQQKKKPSNGSPQKTTSQSAAAAAVTPSIPSSLAAATTTVVTGQPGPMSTDQLKRITTLVQHQVHVDDQTRGQAHQRDVDLERSLLYRSPRKSQQQPAQPAKYNEPPPLDTSFATANEIEAEVDALIGHIDIPDDVDVDIDDLTLPSPTAATTLSALDVSNVPLIAPPPAASKASLVTQDFDNFLSKMKAEMAAKGTPLALPSETGER